MGKWIYKIDLSSEFEEFNEEHLDFEEFKEAVMPKLKDALDEMISNGIIDDENDIMQIEDCIEYLKDSEDEEDWDYNWQTFYDLCDDLRIWVETA
jgi:hypothetical protein